MQILFYEWFTLYRDYKFYRFIALMLCEIGVTLENYGKYGGTCRLSVAINVFPHDEHIQHE